MPITLNKDSINFGNFSISLHPEGIEIDGKFRYASSELLIFPTQAQGSVSGYASAERGNPLLVQNIIDKFPFATDGNATDVGDLTQARRNAAGQSSSTSGYTSGGKTSDPVTNVIDKFPFATNANAADVGDLTQGRYACTGQSSSTSGYTSGGNNPAIPVVRTNTIDKFSFSTDGNSTDVGDLTVIVSEPAGQSSTTHGYASGGFRPGAGVPPGTNVGNIIEKFPFATDANATDVGDLSVARVNTTGQSSAESGYSSAGMNGSYQTTNTVDKFPFATDANATDVGDLTTTNYSASGQSSEASGYNSGGWRFTTIDKFPFSVDANATDVGDLTRVGWETAGQQV